MNAKAINSLRTSIWNDVEQLPKTLRLRRYETLCMKVDITPIIGAPAPVLDAYEDERTKLEEASCNVFVYAIEHPNDRLAWEHSERLCIRLIRLTKQLAATRKNSVARTDVIHQSIDN